MQFSRFLLVVPFLLAGAAGALAAPCPDLDGDSYADCSVAGCDATGLTCGDCDDALPGVHPSATEVCDHRDDDCDGAVDEGFAAQVSRRSQGDRHPHAYDRYGQSVASIGDVDGDQVPDFVVGAPQDDLGATDGGSVTLYSGLDRAVLCRATGASGDILGVSVAAVGDLNGDGRPDFAASESNHDAIAVISGADCSQIARCVDTATGVANLGGDHGLAGFVDITGDGLPEILAGASSSATTLHYGGRAVVFTVSASGTCTLLRELVDPALTIYAYLGFSISGLSDVTGDGVADVAVGEPGYSGYRGAVLVFSGADGAFVRRILDPAGAANDHFGESLATIQCLDGDGIRELVVGSPRTTAAGGSSAGRVLVFSPEDGLVRRDIANPDGGNDWMGSSVAVIPDVDGDGTDDILAGAPRADSPGGADAGKAVLFSGAAGTEFVELTSPDGLAGDEFGTSVACAGDLSGDGIPEILVGAPFFNGAVGPDQGSVSIFAREADCDGDGWAPFGGDCDDTNLALWRVPGESGHLALSADRRTITWVAPIDSGGSGVALSYDLLRSTAPGGFPSATCVASAQADLDAEDTEAPAARGAFYYLARARNACGVGGLGSDGAGDARPGRVCP